MTRFFLIIGGAFAATGVMLGAFGAHGLQQSVSPERLAVFRTGVDYQMWHALALILMALTYVPIRDKALAYAASSVAVGVLIFSGSLYLLVLLDMPRLGMITPIGGTLMIMGWLLYLWCVARASSSPT